MRRPNVLQPKQSAWFVSTIAVTALVVLFCGQQAGLGDDSAAGDPLTLSLSAPQICETRPAQGASSSRLGQDSGGNWTRRYSVFLGYFGVGETAVDWSVKGGEGPYTLVIDGETRDAQRTYEGATGTASVSCAMSYGETFIDGRSRWYREEPEVDSGPKTIRATVTDAEGNTAEASVDVYVILELCCSGQVLESGKTYRLFDGLLTIPEGIDFTIEDFLDGDGGESSVGLKVRNHPRSWIFLSEPGLREVGRIAPSAGVGGASESEIDFEAKFDELVGSVGLLPGAAGDTP